MDIFLLFIYTVKLEGDRAVTQVSGRHDSRREDQKQSNDLGNGGHSNWMELAQQGRELSRLQDTGTPKRCPFWVERLCLPARGRVKDTWASPAWFSAAQPSIARHEVCGSQHYCLPTAGSQCKNNVKTVP